MRLFLLRYVSSIPHQPWLWLILILAINLALVGVMLFLHLRYGVHYRDLVRDMNAVACQPAYFGFYTNLGVLIWAIAACIALFSWGSLVRLGIADRRSRALLLGGLFAALACLDDLFMLHEHAYLLGTTEITVFAGFTLLLLAFVSATLPIAHKTPWVLLAASLAFLALSILIDVLHLSIPGSMLIEEVSKFNGIALLAGYLVTLSFSALAGQRLSEDGLADANVTVLKDKAQIAR